MNRSRAAGVSEVRGIVHLYDGRKRRNSPYTCSAHVRTHADAIPSNQSTTLIDRLNGRYTSLRCRAFAWSSSSRTGASICSQAFQIYVLHWPVPQALGMLDAYYPWLDQSPK